VIAGLPHAQYRLEQLGAHGVPGMRQLAQRLGENLVVPTGDRRQPAILAQRKSHLLITTTSVD
jgi:hypothetical protein